MGKYLKNELIDLHKCMANHVLFLEADNKTLAEHNENDDIRKREAFDHYMKNMLPLKREWFRTRRNHNLDILQVDDMSKSQVGQAVVAWIEKYIRQ